MIMNVNNRPWFSFNECNGTLSDVCALWVIRRLTVVFLAFDVFFIIFCVGMAFIIFFALCCCIPVVAFAYAMTIREGASEDDIRSLPKYRFRQANPRRTFDDDRLKVEWAKVESANRNHVNELCLHPEDSVSTNALSSVFLSFSLVIHFIYIRYTSLLKLIGLFSVEASCATLSHLHHFFLPSYFHKGSLLLQCCNNFEPHLPSQLKFSWHKWIY